MLREAVPLTALTENFSPMPFIAPAPLGRTGAGIDAPLADAAFDSFVSGESLRGLD